MRPVPPGGYSFPDSGTTITASDYDSLIDAIIKDRANNQRPVGDPPREYQAYVLKNWPHFASAASPVSRPTAELAGDKTLRERVTNWLANKYSGKASDNSELVSEETAEKRAKICAQCPHNQEAQNDCPPCVASNRRLGFLIRQGAEVDTKVQACSLMGHDNAVAVWLPEKMLKHRSRYITIAPSECWMKDL